MIIVNHNLTQYMGPESSFPEIVEYTEAVGNAVEAGKLSGPFTTTCPECGSDFADTDEAHEDTEHIIIALTSDTFAVIVACEGYFVVNPNLVGIDSPNWSDGDALGDEVTGVHTDDCNGKHASYAECTTDSFTPAPTWRDGFDG